MRGKKEWMREKKGVDERKEGDGREERRGWMRGKKGMDERKEGDG